MDDRLSAYLFELPEELIAQRPLEERSSSRLLHVPAAGDFAHRQFRELPELLEAGDVLVVNDTRVVPARLHGHKAESGGKVEVVLCRQEGDEWIALVGANKKIKPDLRIVFGGDDPDALFFATVLGPAEGEPGAFRVRFDGDPIRYAQHFGHIPLPPYVKRDDDDDDKERYQTVFADRAGAAAAPTAGLHFDDDVLAALEDKGIDVVRVTLHTGPGTFLPVRTDDLDEHVMHKEPWWVSEEAAARLNRARDEGKRVVAVGTTAVRTLEASWDEGFQAGQGLTDIFIRPGYRFRAIDALVTNFHLPESTLVVLVAAIAGRERVLAAYAEAIEERYRFFSYGDASFFELPEDAKA
jgi:S-adenosylmethionine:tRNA ribosyltransferase-isomerase